MALSHQFKVSTKGKKSKKHNSNDPYDPSKINSLLIIPAVITIFNRIWSQKSRYQMERDEKFKAAVAQ